MKSDKRKDGAPAQQSYETPPEIFRGICKLVGLKPELDVAASATNRKCPCYFTEEDNSLNYNWNLSFWGNPPYKNLLPWVKHALAAPTDGVFLIPVRAATSWFHLLLSRPDRCQITFVKGRISFINPETGLLETSPREASCIVSFGRTALHEVSSISTKDILAAGRLDLDTPQTL